MSIGSTDKIGGDNAPTFGLRVNDKSVSDGVRALVQTLEYESVDGMADSTRLMLADPLDKTGERMLSNALIFAPGNVITASFGYYGGTIEKVGKGIIRKVRPYFPQDGIPTLEVIALTADCRMMDNAPEPLKERKVTKKATKKSPAVVEMKDSKAGRRFKDETFAGAVKLKAEDYGFVADVDETPDSPHDFIHKAGMTDYDFVRGLANITGFLFWVDFDFEDDRWTLHFKNPETYVEPQSKEYNFKWGAGEYSTLLNFEPELAIQGAVTKLKVVMKDPVSGRVFDVVIDEGTIDERGPEVIDEQADAEEKVDTSYITSPNIKLYVGDYSFEIKTYRKIASAVELASWAQQWFRRQRENFILSNGTLVGVENLRARQVHKLSGLGKAYSGRYTFNRVRHIFSADNGYSVDFSGRKVVGDLPQLPPVNRTSPGG